MTSLVAGTFLLNIFEDCAHVQAARQPVHVLAVNALGLHLLDYLQFTELRQVCAEIRRWSFLCMIAPLRLPTGTGSPVNPIAIV